MLHPIGPVAVFCKQLSVGFSTGGDTISHFWLRVVQSSLKPTPTIHSRVLVANAIQAAVNRTLFQKG